MIISSKGVISRPREHWLHRLVTEPDRFVTSLKRAFEESLDAAVPWLLLVAIALMLFALAAAVLRSLRARNMAEGSRRVRVLAPPDVLPQGALTLWMGLHAILRPAWKRALLGQTHLAWEVLARPEIVDISLWVPAAVPPGLVERAIESAWPGARTLVVDPLAGMAGPGHTTGCTLGLAEPDWFPIGESPDTEPLRLALGTLTGLGPDERAVIQVLARPATSTARLRLRRAASKIRRGGSIQLPAVPGTGQRGRSLLDPAAEPDVRAVLDKAASPLWHCSIRLAVSAPQKAVARGKIHALAGAFAVFEGRNGFRRRALPGAGSRLANRRFGRGYLLSAPELAQIAALPSGPVPGLEVARARTVAPPRALPSSGRMLGEADRPGLSREVAISIEDARHHVHLMGETGTGKSTLIARMALDDVKEGRPAVVIDPKGDLVDDILERVPDDALQRTCLLDPSDPEWAVGLDLFSGASRDLVVEHVVTALRRIHEPHWGPRTDDTMRALIFTLTYIEKATIVESLLLLDNSTWRHTVAERLSDVTGVAKFWRQFEGLYNSGRSDHFAAVQNKLRPFEMLAPLRAVLGQSEPKLDIERFIEGGGLLLVRIPKGILGDSSRLFGAFVVARVWQAAMKRSQLPPEQRRDFSLYVDEMHNYLALPQSFEDILAEARGYRLSLVLAHQHLSQLPRNMREAIGANARTKVVFACSPEDAGALERHFEPNLSAYDLHGLEAFQAACRPCLESGHGAAFTLRTRPLAGVAPGRAERVRRACNERWGRLRDEVEQEIIDRHREAMTKLLPAEPEARDRERAIRLHARALEGGGR